MENHNFKNVNSLWTDYFCSYIRIPKGIQGGLNDKERGRTNQRGSKLGLNQTIWRFEATDFWCCVSDVSVCGRLGRTEKIAKIDGIDGRKSWSGQGLAS